MKRFVVAFIILGCFSMKAKAQVFEIEQLLLNVEKLSQLKQMLADLERGYEIVYKGYSTIRDISKGNFSLHQEFLDKLMQVSPAVRNYRKVAEIISMQLRIVNEYKGAFKRFTGSSLFTAAELGYMQKVYANLFSTSLKNLDALAMVISSGILRMSDDERLKAIDQIFHDMQEQTDFLRHFNNQNSVLALQRLRERAGIEATKKLYGVN